MPATAPSESVLLADVSFGWPGAPPLFERLSLSARPGEITALVGSSGCGKSTVLRLVAGLLRASGGSISAPPGERAFVFQSPTLLPWRTVEQNVRLPLELRGDADAAPRVAEALARVGLGDAANLLPRQLSGGMRMRVSLARALVTRPALMLMDEPFSALDPITRKRLQQEFLQLWSEQRFTVLLVSHDIDEAVLLADQIIVLGGKPAGVKLTLRVDLPRPRPAELLHDPRLGQIAATIEGAL